MNIYSKKSTGDMNNLRVEPRIPSLSSGKFEMTAQFPRAVSNLSDNDDNDSLKSASSGRINTDDESPESGYSSGYCSWSNSSKMSTKPSEKSSLSYGSNIAQRMMVSF